MNLCIHRGSHQIGGSCVEVESRGGRILIDLGLPLDADTHDAEHLPLIHGLDGSNDSLLAVLISHPHMDHYGLVCHVGSKIPVYMGEDGRRILESAYPFLHNAPPPPPAGRTFRSGETFTIGSFHITPYLVDHSAYDAYAFLVESDGKRVFYSGDLRMHGRKASLTRRLMHNPPAGINMLLIEGTTIGRDTDEKYPAERDLEKDLREIIGNTPGMVLVHASSQNIDRIVTIYRACKAAGRTMLIDLYTAVVLDATMNEKIPQSGWKNVKVYMADRQKKYVKKNSLFDYLKKHHDKRVYIEHLPEMTDRSVMLFRPIHMPDLDKAGCTTGAAYVYSMWQGYMEAPSYQPVRTWLENHNIPVYHVHTSGHASPSDLKRFIMTMNADRVLPVHTFNPDKFSELFGNVVPAQDGEWIEV